MHPVVQVLNSTSRTQQTLIRFQRVSGHLTDFPNSQANMAARFRQRAAMVCGLANRTALIATTDTERTPDVYL